MWCQRGMSQQYGTRTIGHPNTLDYRIYIEQDGVPLSPFHDAPLYADSTKTVLNMVVEIPRWANNKFEGRISQSHQAGRQGREAPLRSEQLSVQGLWNYGAIPQTWEDPSFVHHETKAGGDNDPLDACEIGERVSRPGEIKQVKVLGILALLDGPETDWKAIVINVQDLLATKLNDIEDVDLHCPGLLEATRKWFKNYKIPDGKPPNEFALSGEFRNKEYAMDIIKGAASAWRKLINGKTDPGTISLSNVTVKDSIALVGPEDLSRIPESEDLESASIDKSIDKWFFNNVKL